MDNNETAQKLFLSGVQYYNGNGTEQDFGKAFDLFSQAAEMGHADAQFFLALCYHNGQGVEQSYRT
ncbi:MAG: sel1 repeat family protein, partial [Bacteroidaceae bacterium]|nr:sel1 repeat family protein [Bacteroidaceae bacterium]